MASITAKLSQQLVIKPPKFVHEGVQYETIMGSLAYGVSSDSSDMDIYGFCIPDKDLIFPHLAGEIQGFGRQIQRFDQYQEHHIQAPDDRTVYDITIFNIVKFFQLCMENNPNMVDSLYTPERCITHSSNVGQMVRDKRDIFLHKGSYHKFKGYAYAQMSKIKNTSNPLTDFMREKKVPANLTMADIEHEMAHRSLVGQVMKMLSHLSDDELKTLYELKKKYHLKANEKRRADIIEHGYSTKFAYHVVRLIDEVEQILTEGTLDLERNREQLKSIRRGEWTVEQIEQHFRRKEEQLESLYQTSTLPHSPNEDAIKALLINCLEEHFGSLSGVIGLDKTPMMIRDLEAVIAKYR